MKNRNIKHMVCTAIAGLFLSACGGGGSSSSGETPPTTKVMIPPCGISVADVTGKTIKKIETGAKVKIIHTPDAKKTACMVQGQAEIL